MTSSGLGTAQSPTERVPLILFCVDVAALLRATGPPWLHGVRAVQHQVAVELQPEVDLTVWRLQPIFGVELLIDAEPVDPCASSLFRRGDDIISCARVLCSR
jgi:hypothetical protein